MTNPAVIIALLIGIITLIIVMVPFIQKKEWPAVLGISVGIVSISGVLIMKLVQNKSKKK